MKNHNQTEDQQDHFFQETAAQKNHKTVLIGILVGLCSAIIYSLMPLLSNIETAIENSQSGFGRYGPYTVSTLYVTWQEIAAAITIFFIFGPMRAIRSFKLLKHREAWYIVLFGFLGGPVAMVFITLAALFVMTGAGLSDGTIGSMLLNLQPVFCALAAMFVLKQKQSNYTIAALAVTAILMVGFVTTFGVKEQIQTKSILGIVFALIAAGLYTLEAIGMEKLMKYSKYNFPFQETTFIKTTFSALFMIVLMPIASSTDFWTSGGSVGAKNYGQAFIDGWASFEIMKSWVVALKFIGCGVLLAFGRSMYYFAIKKASGTYAASTQLLMLIWTPAIQYLMNGIAQATGKIAQTDVPWNANSINDIRILTSEPQTYYWYFVVPIILCLFIITFNQLFVDLQTKGWVVTKEIWFTRTNKNKKPSKVIEEN
ncbi:hypothetical protein SSABA_v1c01000 [Spiroplasma sabaudiense Ar-1343]|uniref:Uncharacterized protein n=1 Tax=Spiroplasma sabaudiense Ar-1343 TaxID=1276257 RepID=W6A923_9MOLU|nr:DMT family transporter [Spiroplasma sabaudiense]AHI53512.1 hypothetical protein SSABA_v1c01000 [Spiroplasma sabaudiense Ar-1343]